MRRTLAVLILCASAAVAAETPELRPLKGDPFKGDLVSVSDKQIVLRVNGKERAHPTEQTLTLRFQAAAPPRDAKFAEVVLVDRTLLRCADVAFKGKNATLTLLGGQTVTAPLTSLASVMKEAHDAKLVAAWKDLFADKKRSYDVVVRKSDGGNLNPLEGTFGDAAEDGTRIEFTPRGASDKARVLLERVHGLAFLRPPDPNLSPLSCKFQDERGNTVMARGVVLSGGKFVVTAQCGVKVEYDVSAAALLDYSGGKITHLADFELSRRKVADNKELTGLSSHVAWDTNLDGDGPMRIAGETFPRGLALHARSELTFDLDGEYREFRAVAGFDDRVSRATEAPVLLRIEGDGKELFSARVTRKSGRVPVALNVIDVNKLRVVVTSEIPLPLGCHLDLADAKVSK